MPRIVVLDGFALNPGDLDWEPLRALGPTVVYDRSTDDQVVGRARGVDCILVNKVRVTGERLAVWPQLRYVGVCATGTDNVDRPACRERGVTVTNTPGYATESTAQHTVALMLELFRSVGTHDAAVHAGRWSSHPDFSMTVAPIDEVTGRTLGLVGLGAIGQRVAHVGHALGMNIAATLGQRTRPNLPFDVRILALDDLLAQSDVVSLHCPATPETRNLLDARRLTLMKPTAYLINTARGALVDEPALAQALAQNRLAGAAVDVLTREPPPKDHPLLQAPRCIITPHCAWAGLAARQRCLDMAVENLRAFLAGQPVNVVN